MEDQVGISALVSGLRGHHGPQSDVIAPFTGEVIARFPTATRADVTETFDRARFAQRAWAARTVRERAAILLRAHDLFLARRDEVLDLLQLETGKARRDALEELLDVAVSIRHYARAAEQLLRPQRVPGVFPLLVRVDVLGHPKGVVGVLAPWNYPLTLAVSDAVPALLAGNTVVLKPDARTSLTALWAKGVLDDAGVPPGVFEICLGDGPVVGPWVIEHADFIMFTGSTRVGRLIAQQCGERLIGCSLELGGKNAMIIRADAHVDRAAEIAVRACFSNAGQLCLSMERILVHESIADAFTQAFLARVGRMRIATGIGWGADMGSLISADQLDRVRHHVDDAVAGGATVLAGGRARPDLSPFAFEPTVLSGVRTGMVACDEETFGPVVALATVRDDDEAIELANVGEYGLNASVITRDAAVGRRIAARLRAGTVNVNEGYAPAWGSKGAPMGGMAASGLGRRHGVEGLLKYVEPQTIATQRILGFGAPFGWSDERWGGTLVRAVGAMKRLGMR